MANKNQGAEKVHRTRKEQHYIVVANDGAVSAIMDKPTLVETLPSMGGKFGAIYKIVPVFVRRVEVIKFGAPRKPRADRGTARADV